MLSEEEKREMKEAARSTALRNEFDAIRALSRLPADTPVDLNQLMRFLTFMSRLNPTAARRPVIPYPNARL